jgi:hypothetical protein
VFVWTVNLSAFVSDVVDVISAFERRDVLVRFLIVASLVFG